ncbi:TonB-linked outer membrane protein, SusC/RagA family [Sinomicrobium oceani]|uniref:TonB-linked outer membrane protein, SusC/RagA family n=1 Tax=Sinomicrobium oceani TaxID=1150368 RepID=A0A1K1QIE5_9FLAO|nr:SusC/RagA family TonB-linked outer membrane protein [Sinomicrobium oceani]SFW59460.1 TonB-linked outer membrane protein, SusC/RagA family [Sinomicrobium oceani]
MKIKHLKVKLSLFFILFSIFHITAYSGYGQKKIDLDLENVPVKEALEEVKKQTGYSFFYREDILDPEQQVSLHVKQVVLNEALFLILRGMPISFTIRDERVFLMEKENGNSVFSGTPAPLSQFQVSGVVTDTEGVPLPGVTVIVEGTANGVTTDFDGNYTISAKEGDILIFRYLGMRSQKVTVSKDTIDVALEQDISELQGVVVTGYQDIDKKVFTGASQTIKAEEMKIDGIVDVGRMLEGRAAGVNVQNVTGTFGAAPKITIRGGSSIFGDTKPLWVVDGAVQEEIVNLSFDQLVSGDATTLVSSAIAGLNANDIESIEILKDASALSLYGARALNGAVIITTKSGKRNAKSTVSYQAEFTIRSIPVYSDYNLLNSQQTMGVYQEMERKGFLNLSSSTQGRYGGVYNIMYRAINNPDPVTGEFNVVNTPESRNQFLRQYEMANTDWFKTLFRSTPTQNHTLSFSGGGETSSQYASIGYFTDPGWSIADRIRRITGNLRNTYHFSDVITAGVLVQGSIRDQKAPGTYNRQTNTVDGEYTRDFDINPFSYALNTSRTLRPRDNNGNLEYYRFNWAPFNVLNEMQNNAIDLKVLDLKLQGQLEIKFNKDLKYNFLGSVRYVKSTKEHNISENSNVAAAYRANETKVVADQNIFLYRDPDNPLALPQVALPNGGIYNLAEDNLQSFYFRNALDYSKTLNNKHDIKLYLGQEYRYTDRGNNFFTGFGYQYSRGGIPFTDYRILQKNLLESNDYFGKTETRERGVAFFAQGTYAFDNRYIISATGNYEGSNQLGKSSNSSRWLPTWNISGKWNVSNEDFLNDNRIISNLSVRAGYGLVAGLGTASNALAIFRNGISNRFNPNDRENIILLDQLENSELTWEKLHEANIGIDLGLFNNRISLSTDIYQKKSYDLIDFVKTSGIGGEYIKLANNADMTTKGIEVVLSARNIVTQDFSWNSTLNFAWFDQKITKIQSQPNTFNLVRDVGGNVVGYQRNSIFSFDFAGLNDEGIPTYNFADDRNSVTGIDFQEIEGIMDYLKYEGPVEPNMTGGLSNIFRYKNWELSTLITMQAGNKIRLTPVFSDSYTDLSVFPEEFKNRWLIPGDENTTNVPVIASNRTINNYESRALSRAYNAYNYSTERIVDGSFVRMKNIALTYNFPKTLTEQLGMRSFLLRIQATNPFLIYSDAALNGQDPEFFRSGGVAYPITRQYTLTLNVGF